MPVKNLKIKNEINIIVQKEKSYRLKYVNYVNVF